ncbi:hypothetical protein BaRGS_00036221, partial [Batillaria attramentaria]
TAETMYSAIFLVIVSGGLSFGQEEPANPFPFLVAFSIGQQEVFCSGSIFNENYILTAAQCGHSDLPDVFNMHVGSSVVEIRTGLSNPIAVHKSDYIVHPSWRTDFPENDVALLKLRTPLKLVAGKVEKGPAINSDPACPAIGESCVYPGWNCESRSFVPQNCSMDVYSLDACQEVVSFENKIIKTISNKQLCTGTNSTAEKCRTYTGLPLFGQCSGKQLVIGIASLGAYPVRCQEYSGLKVYTNVARFSEWIKSNTGESGTGAAEAVTRQSRSGITLLSVFGMLGLQAIL